MSLVKASKTNPSALQYVKIQVTTVLNLAIRTFLWLLLAFVYEQFSAAFYTIRVFNRICLYFNFMSLSFFVRAWTDLVLQMQSAPLLAIKKVKTFFNSFDCLVTVFYVVAVAVIPVTSNDVFNANSIAMGCLYGLAAVIMVVVGIVMFSVYR